MEALAMHRPVIASCIAGIPELVRPGESGWLVLAGSIAELVAAMEAALDADPAQLRLMGEAGAVRVAADHDVRAEVAKLAALFPNPARAAEPAQASAPV